MVYKCCYKGCGVSRYRNKGCKLFACPMESVDIWLKNCGSPKLITKDFFEKRSFTVCEKHFHSENILPSGRLARGAVPLPYEEEQIPEEEMRTQEKGELLKELESVDSNDATQINLNSMVKAMKKALETSKASEMEIQEGSSASNIESVSCGSRNNTQFLTSEISLMHDLEFDSLDESGINQSVLTPFREGTTTQSQDVDCGKEKELLTSSNALNDTTQTISTNRDFFKQSNISSSQERVSNIQEESENDKTNTKKLKSVIKSLESVSDKLTAATLADEYDQFGKYIGSLLRGLPKKEAHSLKTKILFDVLIALEQLRPDPFRPKYKSVGTQAGLDIQASNLKPVGKFLKEKLKAKSIPADSESLSSNTISGNMPLIFSGTSTSKSSFKLVPVIPMSATTSMISSVATVTTPSLQNVSLSPCETVTAVAKSAGGAFLAVSIPKPKVSTSSETSTLAATSPCNNSSLVSQAVLYTENGTQTTGELQSQEDSRNSGGGDDSISVPQPMESEEKEFKIDIEEGNELVEIKQDQVYFETVLNGESSTFYIKEEVPDMEETSEVNLSNPINASAPITCNLRSTQCNNRDQLTSHFSSPHPDDGVQAKKKKYLCVFCKQLNTNLSRHFLSKHGQEEKVKEFSKLANKNPLRIKILSQLRRAGIAEYNETLKKEGKFSILRKGVLEEEATPCPNCKTLYKKTTLHRHYKACTGKAKAPKNIISISEGLSKNFDELHTETFRKIVLPGMRRDVVTNSIYEDPIILEYGNSLSLQHAGDIKNQKNLIRARMRAVGKLKTILHELDESINSIADVFDIDKWNILIQAVLKLGNMDQENLKIQSPNNVIRVGSYMYYLARQVKTACHFDEEGKKTREKIQAWIEMYNLKYNDTVGRFATKMADQKRWERKTFLPLQKT